MFPAVHVVLHGVSALSDGHVFADQIFSALLVCSHLLGLHGHLGLCPECRSWNRRILYVFVQLPACDLVFPSLYHTAHQVGPDDC